MKIPDDFGCLVFSEKVMKNRLPKNVYFKLKETTYKTFALDSKMCNIIANEMKNWAIEHGVTHFSHWFHPLVGGNAEKHESFIFKNENGNVITNFSGKELIKGEPDASSFPSGGLSSTFKSRGYTVWDVTSNAFIKDKTLYIPAVFCSYNGEILDSKIPLLKSIELINKHALRILNLFGNTYVKRVFSTIGAEQEYFLIGKKVYKAREDLKCCGRTLLGASPAKNQEATRHYFSSIKPQILAFMNELDAELWQLGILAKTKHNEVSPAQHELAPIFTEANIAFDQNQLIMEMIQTVAERHGLRCLLHEKPFYDFNGSGKHINWSLATDTGKNLFEPGCNPRENTQFLLFLCAVIKGIDEYQDLLRASVASAGNDLRLGSKEAPCTIMSIFLGDELTEILNAIEKGVKYDKKTRAKLNLGVQTLPKLNADNSDRNRTSPFAFIGNKFEFRMGGANLSIAYPIVVINTIVADELCQFADTLESCSNFDDTLNKIIVDTIKNYKRIIFNGNNYSDEWLAGSNQRGLANFKTSVDAIPQLIASKNIELFKKHKILTKTESSALYNVLLQNYCQVLNTEAAVMINMVKKQIIPYTEKYIKNLCDTVLSKKQIIHKIDCSLEIQIIGLFSTLSSKLFYNVETLEKTLFSLSKISNLDERSAFCQEKILPTIDTIRKLINKIEQNIDKNLWPFPSYSDILFEI